MVTQLGTCAPTRLSSPVMAPNYDVIVIGGGHAGTEAACAASRFGLRVLLVTSNLETIGQMSCNPAIGGIAKGTLVREIDAMGGVMGRAADRAMIQFRMLNRSKGPAVWAPRAQCDRGLYRRAVRSLLEDQPTLELYQATVASLLLSGARVIGVTTTDGYRIKGRTVVLTAGTFLRGVIHLGIDTRIAGGRAGDPAVLDLAEQLEMMGLRVERFKTGTPPRIDARSVDLSRLQRQDGESKPYQFSQFVQADRPEQRPCWVTWAGAEVRAVIERHLHESALFGGTISGRGPRYCPSIEDKIVRFPDAARHQVFLEPEGLNTTELYVNGLSTSLPLSVQQEYLRAVPGLEQVRMTRPGYAIEYDYYPPDQLKPSLEVKTLEGLFFAGQINGTTGYEEAGAQGVVAGVNAATRVQGREPFVLGRDQAYMGVLVDDLVTRGVDEPYRMFTSRAEFRLLLRQDNALRRLGPVARRLGMLNEAEEEVLEGRLDEERQLLAMAQETALEAEAANRVLQAVGETSVGEPQRMAVLTRRPRVGLRDLAAAAGVSVRQYSEDSWTSTEIELKYVGYLERERQAARRLGEMVDFRLPHDLPYQGLASLSIEARQKLALVRPESLAQASRIPGVSPADLQNLVLEVLRHRQNVA